MFFIIRLFKGFYDAIHFILNHFQINPKSSPTLSSLYCYDTVNDTASLLFHYTQVFFLAIKLIRLFS